MQSIKVRNCKATCSVLWQRNDEEVSPSRSVLCEKVLNFTSRNLYIIVINKFSLFTFPVRNFCGCVQARKYFYLIPTNFVRITVSWIINKLPRATSVPPSLISASAPSLYILLYYLVGARNKLNFPWLYAGKLRPSAV